MSDIAADLALFKKRQIEAVIRHNKLIRATKAESIAAMDAFLAEDPKTKDDATLRATWRRRLQAADERLRD